MDIEQWIPVYQGSNELGNWNSYRLPLGDDWLAWHDSLQPINQIQFINEHEDINSSPGSIHFSMIRDITADLPISPIVSIQYEAESIQNDGQNRRMVVSFSSTVQDTDSYSFTYRWEFGDAPTAVDQHRRETGCPEPLQRLCSCQAGRLRVANRLQELVRE